jgi:catalase-peroxidase
MVASLIADRFRNYVQAGEKLSLETLLVKRAFMPNLTVLVGGMRA